MFAEILLTVRGPRIHQLAPLLQRVTQTNACSAWSPMTVGWCRLGGAAARANRIQEGSEREDSAPEMSALDGWPVGAAWGGGDNLWSLREPGRWAWFMRNKLE
jgi:hypothetical protein